jgi:uncharacterized protein YjdB
MKKTFALLCLILISIINYGQIIIDHNCTNLQGIPVSYFDQARTSLHIAYEHTSHGSQIIDGMTGLYNWKGNTYKWNNGGLNGGLDIHDHGITGGSDLGAPDWTSWAASTRSYLKNSSNSDVNVVMWAWCGQVSSASESNINTYLNLMTSLESEFPKVKFVYMTGHLDGTGVNGTLNIRNQQIRNYCRNNNKILYDFADIESYDPDGSYYLDKRANDNCDYDSNNDGSPDRNWATVWQNSHTLNVDWYNCSSAHSQPLNANRKAYAAWWLFARLAGWNGLPPTIPVTGITVTGTSGISSITADNGTLQLIASVLPSNATSKTVTWSVSNDTGQASISSTGLLAAVSNGTVIARATATDGSGVYGAIIIPISNQIIPVTGITVKSESGVTIISVNKGTLQLIADVLPSNATDKSVTWSITNGTGQGTISLTGLVTAVSSGTVTARATSNDGSGVSGIINLTISDQLIPVTGITVTGAEGSSSIGIDNGTLQLNAIVFPSNATNKSVTWSIAGGTRHASVNMTGLVTALTDGTVTAVATSADGTAISGIIEITISNQIIPVSGISVIVEGGSNIITSDKGSLQLTTQILPEIATNKNVSWSVVNITGQATISPTGLVTAIDEGTVAATATATDGTGVNGTIEIAIKSKKNEPLYAIIIGNEIRIPLDGIYSGSKVSLLDLNGTLISSKPAKDTICTFEASALKPGIYVIVLSNSVILRVGKFILPR